MFRLSREKKRLEDWASLESEALPFYVELYRLAKWLLPDQTEAEDLGARNFRGRVTLYHRFERGTNCRAWLITIMYYRLSKRRRRATRVRIVSDAEEQIADTMAVEEKSPNKCNRRNRSLGRNDSHQSKVPPVWIAWGARF